ncbi:Crp/Fnr family transcriptional regulator [Ferruginibacter lapsinanis]|uniref:Crp/Fnr family transcriptional regulator n=1 Tax=Ferruginibacter lapsinanis TaxID=563172 RepID=UPI001E370201|nr:Crp/Fnr family transcriptional regulator [Ferruginibacter lapsinanis]UEG50337.1 Crp/Fnr family transcriptional regulator [Ferruginibacter lapsinanis]
MSFDLILKNIAKHINLSSKEETCFIDLLQQKKLKKRQFLLQEDQVCRYSAFVTKGCLRGYTIDQNGFEHILQFAPRDWWIADMYSLITEQPGNLNIDALDHTEVLLLAKKDQERLFSEIPKFERFFRIITENSLINSRLRLMDNLSKSAQERYLTFCKRYPSLIEWLPQKQIAAYIGVTPEFLSKMRTDFLRKK